jgi:hypothetical protein
MEVDVEEDMMGEEEADRVEADVTGQGMMGDLARLSRISVCRLKPISTKLWLTSSLDRVCDIPEDFS